MEFHLTTVIFAYLAGVVCGISWTVAWHARRDVKEKD